jgi:hypothetical protein
MTRPDGATYYRPYTRANAYNKWKRHVASWQGKRLKISQIFCEGILENPGPIGSNRTQYPRGSEAEPEPPFGTVRNQGRR